MKREIQFVEQMDRDGRFAVSDIDKHNDVISAALYINKACALAAALELEEFPVKKTALTASLIERKSVIDALFQLIDYMNGIEARRFVFQQSGPSTGYVTLDEDWRVKA